MKLWALLMRVGAFATGAETRRCVRQGAVRLNGDSVTIWDCAIPDGTHIVSVGKHRHYHVEIYDAGLAKFYPRFTGAGVTRIDEN